MTDIPPRATLFLIDGNNYVFRAFYAIPSLTNSKGFPTNAIYGFATMLIRIIKEWKPDYIAVAFDVKGPTFRHEAYELYKATRKAIPEALIPQIPYIKDMIRGFSIPVLEKPGIEADDIIGTLARRYSEQNLKVFIVSGDKDMMQLVGENVVIVDTMKEKVFDAAAVKAKFGVPPEQVVEIMGLTGDASDNIPGAPGIGPKGALRLIEEYGTIENVLQNVDRIKNAKAKECIRLHRDQIIMSRELARIRTEEDIPFELADSRSGNPDAAALKNLFREFEFSSLLQELMIREEQLAGQYETILTEAALVGAVEEIRNKRSFSLDLILSSPEAMRAGIVGVTLGISPGKAVYIPLGHSYVGAPSQLSREQVWIGISPLLGDPDILKHGHDLKTIQIVLERNDLSLRGLGFDTLIGAYVLNPSRHSFDLPDLVLDHLNRRIMTVKEIAGSGVKQLPPDIIPVDKMATYACLRADAVLSLATSLSGALAGEQLSELFRDLETPLIPILAGMEKKGVLIDGGLLCAMSRELQQLLEISADKIYRLAGEKFNIQSPKQLQQILFDKLRLAKGKKTKEGYSTDVDVLSSLARHHELPAEILAYRSISKLKSTYIDALPALVHPQTGRVHTSYNQAVTATGRLSSSNPNLQNIPIRTVEGKRIRQAFIAPPGKRLISADYSQIELRVLAHLSEDRTLIDSFRSGEDIHSSTASTIFGVFPELVNEEMRRQAKVINFGILYGMSAFGLAKELNLTQKLAQAYIDEYFRKYEGVKRYLDQVLALARQNGYVCTLMNRRRYLPEINSANANIRQFAERMAVNTPIQGTAADLIKLAMIRIAGRLRTRNLTAAMIMQVHDELVFEVPAEEVETVITLVKEEMEHVMVLRVPLKVAVNYGRNWDDAHC
ncbi:MAG TPA: DNA polymerase I [Syntrophus sp. (in: bacteria)]|jgi:DNA polymerase-1|nr:DNA polymerase I [Syntrophus sp. (in: bacteria)]